MNASIDNAMPRLLVILVAVAILGGCQQYERVDVFVTDVQPLQSTVLEQRLRVSLRFQNANDFAIEAKGLDFELDVNGIPLARGVSSSPIHVPSLGEAVTSVETSTTLLAVLRQGLALTDREDVSYRIDARLHLIAPTKSKLRLRREGLIDLERFRPAPAAPDPLMPVQPIAP